MASSSPASSPSSYLSGGRYGKLEIGRWHQGPLSVRRGARGVAGEIMPSTRRGRLRTVPGMSTGVVTDGHAPKVLRNLMSGLDPAAAQHRNHDDVTTSWSGPPRCHIIVVATAGGASREGYCAESTGRMKVRS